MTTPDNEYNDLLEAESRSEFDDILERLERLHRSTADHPFPADKDALIRAALVDEAAVPVSQTPVPATGLGAVIPSRTEKPAAARWHWPSLPRVHLRFALPSIAIAAVIVVVLSTTIFETPTAQTVSAQVVLAKVARAALPPRGHTTLSRYVIRIRCPVGLTCPKAIAELWISNVGGFYIGTSQLSLVAPGPIGKQSMPGPYGLWVPPHYSGGGGSGDSVRIEAWLRRHLHQSWVYGVYRSALESLVSTDAPDQLALLVRRQNPHVTYPPAQRVSFNGGAAWLVRLSLLGMYTRHARLYIEPASFLLTGLRAQTCTAWDRLRSHFPGCTRYVTFRAVLHRTTTMPICQAPTSVYSWYFRGSGLKPPHRQIPKRPVC